MKNIGSVDKVENPDVEPKKVAAEFGPFSPPQTYEFEPEFRPEPPRKIPSRLRQGAYETKFKQGLCAAFGIGVFCVGFSLFSFVRKIGYYFLPLGYLNWIGYIIVAIAVLAWVVRRIRLGHYNYVRCGIPIIARVLDSKKSVGEGAVTELKFLSLIEYKHPETNEMVYAWTSSPEVANTSKPDAYETIVKTGDYVTAVYLQDKLDKTLKIYGYMGLNPDVDFIRKDGERITEHVSLGKTLALVFGIMVIFVLLVGLIYTIGAYFPMEFNPWHLFGGVFAVALVGAFAGLVLRAIYKPKVVTKETGFLASAFVGFVLGALLGFIVLPLINSTVDRNKPEYQDIEIVEFWQETWEYIFRNYQIEYRLLGGGKTDKQACMLGHMMRFEGSMAGVLEIRTGLFGWRWIRNIWPAVLVRVDEEGRAWALTDEEILALRESKAGELPFEVDLAIDRGKDGFMPISNTLRQHIINRQSVTNSEQSD